MWTICLFVWLGLEFLRACKNWRWVNQISWSMLFTCVYAAIFSVGGRQRAEEHFLWRDPHIGDRLLTASRHTGVLRNSSLSWRNITTCLPSHSYIYLFSLLQLNKFALFIWVKNSRVWRTSQTQTNKRTTFTALYDRPGTLRTSFDGNGWVFAAKTLLTWQQKKLKKKYNIKS